MKTFFTVGALLNTLGGALIAWSHRPFDDWVPMLAIGIVMAVLANAERK